MNRNWSEIEDKYLINEYGKSKKEIITKYLGRSWMSIQSRASRLGVKKLETEICGRKAKIWDNESITYLVTNYEKTDKDELIITLDRSWSSIQNKAFLLDLKRDVANANVTKLMNDADEAYYWLGFIMADGHFHTNKQLQINLAEKDLNHLKRFAEFVEYTGELKKPSINIDYTKINNWLVDTFDISNNKTYNPCDLTKLTGDKMFSLCVGFIDGDGCISTNGNLRIKCHKSWLYNINKMVSFLCNGDYNEGRIDAEGLAIVQINKTEHMKAIKQKATDLKLPMLERKWSRVKETKLSKKERSIKNMIECRELFNKGLSVKEVIEITKLSKTQVYKQKQIICKNND